MKLIEIEDNFYQMFTSTFVLQQLGHVTTEETGTHAQITDHIWRSRS